MSRGHTESFRSHSNYLRAFAVLCSAPYQAGPYSFFQPGDRVLTALAPQVVLAPTMSAPMKAKPDLSQARSSLVNAWGTELLLALGSQVGPDEELVRLMNNWAVVQAYYASFHALQALVVARGHPRPQDHSKTQAQFATHWVDRSLHLPPWSLGACDGGWRNAPAQGIDDSLSPWASCDADSCWNLAAKALRTTREEKLKVALSKERDRKRSANVRAWNGEEKTRVQAGRRPRVVPQFARPHLSAAEKAHVSGRLRSYTILDYLFRLRVKTNYVDAGMFIEGPEDDVSSKNVHDDLVGITSCTLLVHELHIGAIVGKSRLMAWADDWLSRHSSGAAIGLGRRRGLLYAHLS